MGGNDIIKNSILEKFQTGNLNFVSVLITLGLAIVFGLFIYFVYRFNSRDGFYNKDFNKSLATLPLITAAIMLAMGSNLTISLGMVGALSIVRFRNAIKEPMDLTYLFWSISVGIVSGAGLFELSVILCIAAAVVIFLLDLIPALKSPCLLVVLAESIESENAINESVKKYAKKFKVRSRNIGKKGAEWIIELQIKEEAELVNAVSSIEGVSSVHLMSHDGSVRF